MSDKLGVSDIAHFVWAGITMVFGYLGSKVIGHYDFRIEETEKRIRDTEGHSKEIMAAIHELDKKITRIETRLERKKDV